MAARKAAAKGKRKSKSSTPKPKTPTKHVEDSDVPSDHEAEEQVQDRSEDEQVDDNNSADLADAEEEEEADSPPPAKKGRPSAAKKGKKGGKKVAAKGKGKAPATPKKAATPKKKSAADEADGKDSDEEEDNTDYAVDYIEDMRLHKDGSREFLVKWVGYSKKDSTWEPENNLDCPDKLAAFMKKLDQRKNVDDKTLRTQRKQTQPYQDSVRNKGVRASRRFAAKPRTTYHGLED